MVRKLQIKFIVITMMATIIVIGGIFGVITFENYTRVNRQIDAIMNLIVENGGSIPEYKEPKDEFADIITKETQYSTRYFTITINESGEVVETDMQFIAAVSPEDISELLEKVLSSEKTSGFINNYKYRVVEQESKTMIVFLDSTILLNSLNSTMEKSVLIVIGGLIIVFIVITVLSKRILNPIVESWKKQKQFITDASHELKTPLAVIAADIDVLEMTVGEDNEWINSIKNQTNRLNTLIKSLLNLSNLEERTNQQLEIKLFSMTELVKEQVQEFKALLKDKEIKFNKETDVQINADYTSMKQLITILLDNSIKYTPDGGTIEINLERHNKNTKIEISNTCENAKNINTKRIFDRFYREDKSRNKKKEGYGIGLSIAKSIVDTHKGKISAECTKNGMICFRVII